MKTPLCIHRAPLGTHERFIGFLIEHYAGNFPLWLAPDQVRVITLNDDEALINYAKPIVAELRANMVRVDSDFSATPFKAKIANAEQLDLKWLTEEQLLLAVPLVPLHADAEECESAVRDQDSIPLDKRNTPFAQLRELLKK